MSVYDSLGETTFSTWDLTISKVPPFRHTRSIAYNGTYWLAGGTIVIRSVGIKSFPDVLGFENTADNYTRLLNLNSAHPTRTATQKSQFKVQYEVERTKNLDLAQTYFNDLKANDFILQSYTRKTVHCFAISTDGYSWKYVEECPLTYASFPNTSSSVGDDHFNRINGVAWNGSKWMAVGRSMGTVSGTYFPFESSTTPITGPWPESFKSDDFTEIVAVESTDGIVWTISGIGETMKVAPPSPNDSGFEDLRIKELNCVTCDTTKWIAGGDNGLWRQNFTDTTWTSVGTNIVRTHYRGIATDGINWVAVGGADSKEGFYSGSVNSAGAIVSSVNDGVTWATRLNWDMSPIVGKQTFKAVSWNGDRWIAVGVRVYGNIGTTQTFTGVIARSEDGVDWTVTEGYSTGLSCISWDGNEWFAGSTNENILVSKDGFLWSPTTGDTSGVLTIATSIVLPILGGDINTVRSLLVGIGNPSSVLRSYNTTEWTYQLLTDSKKQFQAEPSRNMYGVAWTGTKWLVVGDKDVFGRSIAVSDTGIDWVYPVNGLSAGRQIAYGGDLYIAVGDKLVTSPDSETWTTRTSPMKSLHCIAYNGTSLWVAGGDGGIQYSANGTSWTKSVTCPLTVVRGVAWNGYYWVATGTGPQHSVMLSKDGNRWYIANESSVPFSDGFSIAWNRSRWIAVGNGSLPVARSSDGYTWESIATTPLTNGQHVSWTGSQWLIAGYGSSPAASSVDTNTWTEYPILLTRASGFATHDVILPFAGATSDLTITLANAVLDDLTAKTNATILREEAAIALAADQAAQAALLVLRNGIKDTATDHLTRILFWNDKIDRQVQPFKPTSLIDISLLYPIEYRNVQNTIIEVQKLVTAATVYKNRIHDDSQSYESIQFDLDTLATSVKLCEEGMVDFYNAARVLYINLVNELYTIIALTPDLLVIVDEMEFPTETRSLVRTMIIAKQAALDVIRSNVVIECSTPILEVSYSNQVTDAPDYTTLFKTFFGPEVTTPLYAANYSTDDTNPFIHLVPLKALYPIFHEKKIACDALVTSAYNDAVKWSTLLEITPPTLQSIKNDFEPLYEKYFRTVGIRRLPVTTFDTPNASIGMSDTPVRSFKALSDDYKNPLAYPAGLEALFTRLKATTDTVNSTRQAAMTYMLNKRKTDIKTKLDNIFDVTKTRYTGPLLLDQHVSKISAIAYHKDSDYTFCIDLLGKLKRGYQLGAELRPKLNDIELADIAAEEDGCVPPERGWGSYARSYAIFEFPLSTGLQFTTRKNPGSDYLVGEEIVIPGTHFKGISPTNDITLTVKDVDDFSGGIVTWNASGTFPSESTVYSAITGSRSENGTARFNVTPTSSGYTVSIADTITSGYVVGQQIGLSGETFNRKSPDNNILVTVTSVNSYGAITGISSTGNSSISYENIVGLRNDSASFTFAYEFFGQPSGQNLVIFIHDGGIGYVVGDAITFDGRRFGGLTPTHDITITVASVNSSGSILTFTYAGILNEGSNYRQRLDAQRNVDAVRFSFSNITNATSYTAAITQSGSIRYYPNDRIVIRGASFRGGKSPANDFTVKVNTVSSTGAILTFSIEGSFGFLFSQTLAAGNVVEQNASFNIVAKYSPIQQYTVLLNSPGDGYTVGEQIVIRGDLLSGISPTNNITLTVTGVSQSGGITTFTTSGTPNTVFRFDSKPSIVITKRDANGRPGMNGWQFFNDTYKTRDELARYMNVNSRSIAPKLVYKPQTTIDEYLLTWRSFLDFINTTTYDGIVDAIEQLETKVDLLTSNLELTTGYIDGLVTTDIATIQSKYEEFAIAYTQALLDSVNTIVPSAKFSVTKSGGVYTVSLVNAGYGYEVNEDLIFLGTSLGGTAPTNTLTVTIRTIGEAGEIRTFVKKSGTASSGSGSYIVTNNKLADRFPEIASAQAVVEENYSTLYTTPTSIPGQTNQEITTLVANAISAKNTITAIQNNNVGFPVLIRGAITYIQSYNAAKNKVLQFEDDLIRWTRMKDNAYYNSPFTDLDLSNGVGEPFIMSIAPTNELYWTPVTYTLYKTDPASDTVYECTLDENTQKVITSIDPIDITTIDAYGSTQQYTEGMYVKFDNSIYICIQDNTPNTFNSGAVPGVKNVNPLRGGESWIERTYPYVIDGNTEVEFNDAMCVPYDSSKFNTYKNTGEYRLGTLVNYENNTYVCSKTVTTDGDISGISPDNSTYWNELQYPIVNALNGTQFEAKPSAFSAVNPSALSDALVDSYNFGDFAKTTVTYVDDQGLYRTGTSTFQLDNDKSSTVSKGYPPTYTYINGTAYHNYYMWEYVQVGRITSTNHPTYSESSFYRRGDYVVYTGSFIKQDGTTASNVLHTFKLIATYPSENPAYSTSIVSPFYASTAGFPVATKIQGVVPTETPWSNLRLAGLSDTIYGLYSNTTLYNLNDIVRYSVEGTLYVYQFVGTMPKYNNAVYIYFGKVSGNKNPWTARSYPGVYYNNVIVETAPGNIPQLNPANYPAYSSEEDYSQGEYVSYNNKVYRCGYKKVGILYNIPTSNRKFWSQVFYKTITYNGQNIEAAPGSIPKLDSDDYDEYDPTVTYLVGDIVKVTQSATGTLDKTPSVSLPKSSETLSLSSPQDVTTDRQGNIYILDRGNKVIKKAIAEIDGYTVVNIGVPHGNPRFATVDGTTSNASYFELGSITIDNATNTIYFTDGGSVRKVTANGEVITIAGYRYLNGILHGYENSGTGSTAKFGSTLYGLCFDKDLNCLYVSDTHHNVIRKISLTGTFAVTTHVGPSTPEVGSFANGTTTDARFNYPTDMDIDEFGTLYVTDTNNHCIRKITSAGVVTTLAGSGGVSGYFDSTGTTARFSSPRGIAVSRGGYVFVADTGNNRIRRITQEGLVDTFAGTGASGSKNGEGYVATFSAPRGLSVDRYDNVYVSDYGSNQVRKLRPDGRVVPAVRVKASIHECRSYVQTNAPIVNIPPTNARFWKKRTYPLVYVNDVEYEADPDNTAIFKQLNQYDYHRYDNNWMYRFGDLTSYNGQVYQCINTVPVGEESPTILNIPPTNTVHWLEVRNDESMLSATKPWVNGVPYRVGDVIRYLNALFQCNFAHTGNTDSIPNRPVKWKLDQKYVPNVPVWEAGVSYEANQYVYYNGKQYKCLLDNTSSITETPSRIIPWIPVTQLTASNIIEWDLNVQYLVGTNVIYNGFFYKCELEHYSSYIDSPYGNKYYWSQVIDLSTIGIPPAYSSTSTYTINTVVSFRMENPNLMRNDDDRHIVKFYKCVKTDPNHPSKFTYDTITLVDSKDASGNYEYGKILGTWNRTDLPRYGTEDDDAFRAIGFAGDMRRRVWMEIEMPYGRVLPLRTIGIIIEDSGIASAMSELPSFGPRNDNSILLPTDYTTDYNFVKNKLETVANAFMDNNIRGTGDDNLPIEEVIANAYELITEDIKTRKNVPYVINTNFNAIADGDENKCIDQLMEEVNIMKTQYFNLPGTQMRIFDDPYSFINPAALAEDPPIKLFKDLGVGDLLEIQAGLNREDGVASATYNPDGTVVLSDTFEVSVPYRKYTRGDLDYTLNRTEVMNSKLELISMSCFEVKQRIGFGMALNMELSKTKMGGRFQCDSGNFDIPIGEYPVLTKYKNYGDTDKMMYNFFELINESIRPPDYTLPSSRDTRALQSLTFESTDPFVKGLSAFAKGAVGLMVSFGGGKVTGMADLANGIASLHALVLDWRGEPLDDTTAAAMAITNVNFVKFNQNNDSINTLKEQANIYREILKKKPFEITEDTDKENERLGKLIARLEYLLFYIGFFESEAEYARVERTVSVPPPMEIPITPTRSRRVFQKPIQPQDRALTSLNELKDYKARLIIEKMNLETALALNFGHPPLPKITLPIVELQIQEVRKTIAGASPAKSVEFKGLTKSIEGIQTRISVQQRTIRTQTANIRQATTQLPALRSERGTMVTLDAEVRGWIGPPRTSTPSSITIGGTQYPINANPTVTQLESLSSKVRTRLGVLTTNISTNEGFLRDSPAIIAEARTLKKAAIQELTDARTTRTKWLMQWRSQNPNTTVTEYISESQADFNKRLLDHEAEFERHKAQVEEIKKEATASEMRRKARIGERLNLNATELAELEQTLTNTELENRAIELENSRNQAQYRRELEIAEADELVAEKNYRRAMSKYRTELTIAKYNNRIRRQQMDAIIRTAFEEANEYYEILNQKKQVTAIKYLAFEEIVTGEYHVTGTFIQRLLKNAFLIPYEILATALNFSMGIGEVPYRVQELITGRLFYNALSASARLRIDVITDQLNAIPNAVGSKLQSVLQEQLTDFLLFINRRRRFKLLLNSNPRLLKRGFGTVFAGRTGRAVSRIVSALRLGTELSLNSFGNTPRQRFLGGLGFAAEFAGAAMGAWQGGAFEQAATLGV